MKEPKTRNLVYDKVGTRKIRKLAKETKKSKITINFDSDILAEVKEMAEELGSPYQTLLNKIVRDAVSEKRTVSERLSKLEKEVRALKKKLA